MGFKKGEEINFEIVDHIGVIAESTKGWNKELNLVSWNGKEAKYDIRDWSEDHTKMGKGATFNKDELVSLRDILKEAI